MKSYFSDIQFFTDAVHGRNCIPLLGTSEHAISDDPPKSRIYTFRGGRLEAMARPWQARAIGFCLGIQCHGAFGPAAFGYSHTVFWDNFFYTGVIGPFSMEAVQNGSITNLLKRIAD